MIPLANTVLSFIFITEVNLDAFFVYAQGMPKLKFYGLC